MTTTNQTDPDAQCPTHGCARWRCDADHPAATAGLTAGTVTNKQIRALADDAAVAGDHLRVAICDLALGRDLDDSQYRDFFDEICELGIDPQGDKSESRVAACGICADAINNARAQADT